jgi:peptide/nickel transport system permease protein
MSDDTATPAPPAPEGSAPAVPAAQAVPPAPVTPPAATSAPAAAAPVAAAPMPTPPVAPVADATPTPAPPPPAAPPSPSPRPRLIAEPPAPEPIIAPPPPRPLLSGLPLRLSLIATLLLLLAAFVSLVWTPHPVDRSDVAAQLLDPGAAYLLGTDAQGRDVLSLLMKGMLTSYVVAAIGVAVGLFVGVPLGVLAALRGGHAARAVRYFGEGLASLPALAVAALLAVLAGAGAASAMVAIGLTAIPHFARLTQAAAGTLLGSDYFAAARLSGMSLWEAANRHVVPDLRTLLLSRAATALGFAILAEAALSYAGLAAQPGAISLGLMLREAQSYLLFEPVLTLAPGIAVVLMALLLQIAGDRLARTLDPRLAELEADHGAA